MRTRKGHIGAGGGFQRIDAIAPVRRQTRHMGRVLAKAFGGKGRQQPVTRTEMVAWGRVADADAGCQPAQAQGVCRLFI